MKKILILGTGSVGSEIAYSFYDKNEIICVDHGKNFSKTRNLLPNAILIKNDIHNVGLFKKEIKDSEIIFYSVDTGTIQSCLNYPEKYKEINTVLFRKLLKSISRLNSHFFLLSSNFVYSDIANVTEITKPNPETLYGKLRLAQENILKSSSFTYTILRLSNIFGYGKFFNLGNMSAVEKFIDCAFMGKKIVLHGNGNQKVDYLCKTDLMDLLRILIRKLSENRIYNVCSGITKPISEIAESIKIIALEKFKKKVEIPNCFLDLLYPPILGKALGKMAPSFSVATGVALGGLET